MKKRYLIHYISDDIADNKQGRVVLRTDKPIRTYRDIEKIEKDISENKNYEAFIISYIEM